VKRGKKIEFELRFGSDMRKCNNCHNVKNNMVSNQNV